MENFSTKEIEQMNKLGILNRLIKIIDLKKLIKLLTLTDE